MDRQRESQDELAEARERKPEPAAPVQIGSMAWASAVGNAAVARLARQTAQTETEAPETESTEAPEGEAAETEAPEAAGAEPEAEEGAEAEAGADPEAVPEELPE